MWFEFVIICARIMQYLQNDVAQGYIRGYNNSIAAKEEAQAASTVKLEPPQLKRLATLPAATFNSKPGKVSSVRRVFQRTGTHRGRRQRFHR